MNRIGKPSPAIVVAVLAIVAALAGTAIAGPDATTSAGVSKKKFKKLKKQVNELQAQVKDVSKQQGPQGEQGVPGEAATRLFAWISDDSATPSTTAIVAYGRGVTAVNDPDGANPGYTVTFNRSLANCVVNAESGTGNPRVNTGNEVISTPSISMTLLGNDNQVRVTFEAAGGGGLTDTSFFITAFC